MHATEETGKESTTTSQSDVDPVIAHQDACTAKLQVSRAHMHATVETGKESTAFSQSDIDPVVAHQDAGTAKLQVSRAHMHATEEMGKDSIAASQSDIDRVIAHQDACMAKLQEQIAVLITSQEKLHQQLLAESPRQTPQVALDVEHLQASCKSDNHGVDATSAMPVEERQRVNSLSPCSEVACLQQHTGKTQQVAHDAEQSDEPPTIRNHRSKVSEMASRYSDMATFRHSVCQPPMLLDPTLLESDSTTKTVGLFDSTLPQGQPQASLLSPEGIRFEPTSKAAGNVAKTGERTEKDGDQEQRKDRENRNTTIRQRLTKVTKRLTRAPTPLLLAHGSTQEDMRNVQSDLIKTTTDAVWASPTAGTQDLNDRQYIRFVRSVYFDYWCGVVLISNAFFISLQVEYAAQQQLLELPTPWKVTDYVYGVWFIIELLLRLKSAGLSFFYDPEEQSWNIFDFIIVSICSVEMVFSAFVSSGPLRTLSMVRMVRVARIARIARVIRLMRFFRSLRILLRAIFSTLKSCMWAAMLFFIILYLFAITFVQGTTEYRIQVDPSQHPEGMDLYYGSLPRGIFTLFKSVLGGVDWETAVTPLAAINGIYVVLFVLMIVFIYLAVINVISALFLQDAVEAGHSDREDVIGAQLKEKALYVRKALSLFHELDDSESGQIRLEQFAEQLQDHRIIGFFNSLEIDMTDAWSLFTLLDVDRGGTVTMDEFVEGCLNLKGNAKSLHIAQILYENKWIMDAIFELTKFIDIQFEFVQDKLTKLAASGQDENPENKS